MTHGPNICCLFTGLDEFICKCQSPDNIRIDEQMWFKIWYIVCICVSIGPLIVVVCALKMLRFAFSDTPRQYMILTFTVFFFKYDFRWSSEKILIDYFFISILFCKVRLSWCSLSGHPKWYVLENIKLCRHSRVVYVPKRRWLLSVFLPDKVDLSLCCKQLVCLPQT